MIHDGVLLGLSLLQVVVGVLFFRTRAALVWFFFQSLLVIVAAIATLSFAPDASLMVGWSCRAGFSVFFFTAFRAWRRQPQS